MATESICFKRLSEFSVNAAAATAFSLDKPVDSVTMAT
jgi:hypothetical protein